MVKMIDGDGSNSGRGLFNWNTMMDSRNLSSVRQKKKVGMGGVGGHGGVKMETTKLEQQKIKKKVGK